MQAIWPKVMLVEEGLSTLEGTERILRDHGYEVQRVIGSSEAVSAIEEDAPHYLITPWHPAEIESCQRVFRAARRDQLPHYIYLLALKSRVSAADRIAGLLAGADDVLDTDVAAEELLAHLQAGARVLSLESRLVDLARTDPLTGVFTRRAFDEQADRELRRARRYNLSLACVMIDIDFFKKVNDTHGHGVGDEVLRIVAGMLRDNCRGGDYVGRYGGEEFCALLTESDEHAADVWAQRVREAISRLRMPVGEKELKISASLGVSELLDDTSSISALVDMADQALLVAKQSGRDRVVCFRSLNETSGFRLAEEAPPFDRVLAHTVMSPLVACLNEHETIGQAIDFCLRCRINSCPVVDDNGKLVGILSEKDVIAAMTDPDCLDRPIWDVMKRNVVCYEEDAPVKSIYEFLCRVSIRRVIVVKDGIPTGIISRGTLLRWYTNWMVAHGDDNRARQMAAQLGAGKNSRHNLVATAAALSQEARTLHQALASDTSDCLALLIGRASKMQELINDALCDSRSFAGSA